jgi:exopolyphosphatase/guanosine-5'-triphosphate,3'-diphosphate pyrophosphatase
MVFAAIDIGSNAVRLMFANALDKDGLIRVEKATLIRIPIRLGKDVYKNNTISKNRTSSLIKTLKAFKLLIDVYKPEAYVACATAAMREATNGPEILSKIKKETGIKIRLIDGLEEAEIIRSTNNIASFTDKNMTMYVDLGGGSTEISVISKTNFIDANSFKIGTLRILSKKVDSGTWDELASWLNRFKENFGKMNMIGSGGNINKIAKLYGKAGENEISLKNLEQAYKHLKSYTLHERIEELGLRPDRADVIVPAAKVFLFIAKTIKAETIMVPKIGLTDGLIHKLYEEYLREKPKNSRKTKTGLTFK